MSRERGEEPHPDDDMASYGSDGETTDKDTSNSGLDMVCPHQKIVKKVVFKIFFSNRFAEYRQWMNERHLLRHNSQWINRTNRNFMYIQAKVI